MGNVYGNDNEFGFAIVLGHLDLGLAHRELAARGIAFRPNLIKEIVVAQTLEHKGCLRSRLSLLACV